MRLGTRLHVGAPPASQGSAPLAARPACSDAYKLLTIPLRACALPAPPRCTASGVLQPNEYSLLRVSYAPRATGTFSCQRFCLATRGGNRLQLSCQGVAAGPALRLSARVFAFGCVRAGAAPPPQLLTLENESDVPLAYEFQVEPHGVFGLSRPCGTLPPRGCTRLALCFRALAPGNYWQRIVCLVKVCTAAAAAVLLQGVTAGCRRQLRPCRTAACSPNCCCACCWVLSLHTGCSSAGNRCAGNLLRRRHQPAANTDRQPRQRVRVKPGCWRRGGAC